MFESRNRPFAPALAAALAGIALGGCHASSDGPESPPPPTDLATARFDLATGVLPSATNLLIGPEDYTLNLPAAMSSFRPLVAALNAVDGWSTTAGVDTSFTLPIDASSIGASSIKIVKFYMNPSLQVPASPADPAQAAAYLPTGATSPVIDVLDWGSDFTAEVTQEPESEGKILRITPLKPLEFSKGPAVTGGKVLNIGYTVLLTSSLKTTDGRAYGPDTLYAAIKSAPANCSSFTDATQNKVCLITKANLGVAAAASSTTADSVILSWTFSTQSIDDPLNVVALTATPKPTLIVPAYNALLGRILTTKDANAALPGKANIYLGSTQLPYYLTAATTTSDAAASAAVLSSFWQASGPPPAPFTNTARPYWLTMFNPVPAATSTVTVPLLVTVPNATSACGGVMPAGGWPIVVVQHGITGDRSQALAMADSMADACTIVVGMDLPLHGLTVAFDPNPANPNPLSKVSCAGPLATGNAACIGGARERTFDVDLVRNSATTVAVPDGAIDPSGTHFINLASPLTSRDNLRQAEADLIQLTKSLPGLTVAQAAPGSLPAGPVTVNATHISYVGLSLGAIVGGSHLHFVNDVAAATLSVPGGVITQLLLDSQSFGPAITAGLSARGLVPGGYVFGQFMRDFQTVIDSGDPINHIADATALHPMYLQKVIGDRVVPNNATDRLIARGGFTKVSSGMAPVLPGSPKYVAFPYGTHGSLFSPGGCLTDAAIKDDPAKVLLCQKTTAEMQRQTVIFTSQAAPGGLGSAVVVTDTSVVQP